MAPAVIRPSRLVIALFGLCLAAAHTAQKPPVSICSLGDGHKLVIGQRIRVSGYVDDLGSHGFVLTGKRGCLGQIGLDVTGVDSTPEWHRAFYHDKGPRWGVILATVAARNPPWCSPLLPRQYCHRNVARHIPVLKVEKVEKLARKTTDLNGF
jgi:hypothetical protein